MREVQLLPKLTFQPTRQTRRLLVCLLMLGEAVIAGIFFLVLSTMFFGTAHAASTSCTSGLFSACSDSDLSIQWMDYIFSGKPLSSDAYTPNVGNNVALQAAFGSALKFFSAATLFLAGLIMLFHLFTMTAETAHTGKAMGRANQIWTPVRLVVALCLLLPVSSSGLNAGQSIVLQMAKWGCGLASHTWAFFLETLTTSTGNIITMPMTPPMVDKIVQDVLLSKACMLAYNDMAAQSGIESSEYTMAFNGTTFASGADGDVCGLISYPKVPSSSDLSNTAITSLYSSYAKAFSSFVNDESVENVAKYVLNYQKGNFSEKQPDEVNPEAVEAVKNKLKSALAAALPSQNDVSATVTQLLSSSRSDGWLSAGAWFNAISRIEGSVMDAAADAVPSTTPPDLERLHHLEAKDDYYADNNFEKEVHRPYETIANSVKRFNISITKGAVRRSSKDDPQTGTNANLISSVFTAVNYMGGILGVWPAPDGKLLFELKTTNPFTEVVSFGHRYLDLGLELMTIGFTAEGISGLTSVGVGYKSSFNLAAATPVGLGIKIAAGFSSILSQAAAFVIGLGCFMAFLGGILTFVLPLIPFVRYFFNILSWALVVFEAVVSAPFFALAHLSPYGDGFAPSTAHRGYHFLLNILFRPALMVFGLIAGLLLFFVAVVFLNKMFLVAAASSGAYNGFASLSKLAFSFYYIILVYVCANTCFKAISHFPDHAMNWMSASGVQTKDLGDAATINSYMQAGLGYLGTKGVGRLSGHISGLPAAASSLFLDPEKHGSEHRAKKTAADIAAKSADRISDRKELLKSGKITPATYSKEMDRVFDKGIQAQNNTAGLDMQQTKEIFNKLVDPERPQDKSSKKPISSKSNQTTTTNKPTDQSAFYPSTK